MDLFETASAFFIAQLIIVLCVAIVFRIAFSWVVKKEVTFFSSLVTVIIVYTINFLIGFLLGLGAAALQISNEIVHLLLLPIGIFIHAKIIEMRHAISLRLAFTVIFAMIFVAVVIGLASWAVIYFIVRVLL